MTPAVIVAIVSAVIAACSLGYTIWDKTQGQRRRLRWSVASNTSLLSAVANDRSLDKLSVHWDGADVRKPRLAVVHIMNTGKVELKESDVSVRPRIQLDQSKIVSAQVILHTAGSDRASVIQPKSSTDSVIEAPQLTLNPGDRLVFSLLLDGDEERLRPTMQAAGFRFESPEEAAKRPAIIRLGQRFWELDFFTTLGILLVAAIVIGVLLSFIGALIRQ